MGDTNTVIDLPNIIKSKSSIQLPCQGDPERLIVNYNSLIGKDTAKIEVKCSFYDNPILSHEVANIIDSTGLNYMVYSLLARDTTTRITFKKIMEVNKEILYVIKYTIDEIPYWWIIFNYRSNTFSLKIENIKDDDLINKIINSFKLEDKRSFICW